MTPRHVFAAAALGWSLTRAFAAESDLIAEGRALAAELRAARPPREMTNQAVLKVRAPDGRRSATPVAMATQFAGDTEWRAVYTTPSQTLVITHRREHAPTYQLGNADGTGLRQLAAGDAASAFAGSDFWPCDLGLEFLSWPIQKVIRREKPEMRKGRPCRLLESANPTAPGYVRVRSWIDLEEGQPIMAEAYDANNDLVKTFSVGSVEKVDGVWRLKDLDMTDERRGSKTRLEFEYKIAEASGR
jgi:Outer membrane lipoprotein-sorting protein